MFVRRKRKDRERDDAVLDRAIVEWQGSRSAGDILGGKSRGRIIDETLNPAHDPAAPASLFLPARRLAMAGALPVLLGVVLLLLLGHAGSYVATGRAQHILVEKHGGEVVFWIPNGGTRHFICKSADPSRFDCDHGVNVRNGRYTDPIHDGSDLVFYRID